MDGRGKYPGIAGMTRGERQRAIEEACFNSRDRDIAELYFIEGYMQADIAATLCIARGTVGRKLPEIAERIEYIGARLDQKQNMN